MAVYKVTFQTQVDVDVWLDADSADHAKMLVEANDRSTYDRIKSSVSLETGSIRIDTASINVSHIEAVV